MEGDSIGPQSFVVPAACKGERLDRVLVQLLGGASRVRIQELIRDGGVRVDGETVLRPSFPVAEGSELTLSNVTRSRERSGGAGADFTVVWEDEALAVVDKPAGMVVHPSGIVRGGTLSERAVARWGELPAPQGADRPGIVHRLDADTSGLVVVALQARAAEALVRAFREREVEKVYQAIVHGTTRFDSDWITARIGRRTDRPDRMSVMAEGGREAETFYRTEERFEGFSILACSPKTGRTHQIRVHLAHIGHPLVGDRVYKGRTPPLPADAPAVARHMLHASELSFVHPLSGERLTLRSEPPADMRALADWLRAKRRS